MTRLRRSVLTAPGIRRVRRGHGFSYLDPAGDRLAEDEALERIEDLVIPPVWRDAWIAPQPNGHIQAVGTDAAGRRQYLYHPQWRRDRDEEKHDRVLAMAKRLPGWRTQVEDDLAERGLTERRVLGAALRMLDRGIFHTGGEEYAQENGSHGVATLLREHACVREGACVFEYPAKGGAARAVSIDDPALVEVLRSLLRSRADSDRLLVYRTPSGWHEIHAADVNERFKELAGRGLHGQGPAHLERHRARRGRVRHRGGTEVEGGGPTRGGRGDPPGLRSARQHPGRVPGVLCGPPSGRSLPLVTDDQPSPEPRRESRERRRSRGPRTRHHPAAEPKEEPSSPPGGSPPGNGTFHRRTRAGRCPRGRRRSPSAAAERQDRDSVAQRAAATAGLPAVLRLLAKRTVPAGGHEAAAAG